jgi:predicted Zn-dependent protease
LYVLHAWQVGRTAHALFARASSLRQKEEWFKAAEFLDRYLRLKPQDDAARHELALTYARAVRNPLDRERAISLHYRALATGRQEGADDLRRSLGQLLLANGRFVEAEKEARTLLAQHANDPAAARLLALALLGQLADGSLAGAKTEKIGFAPPGQPPRGLVQTVEWARDVNPADLQLAVSLAVLLRDNPAVVTAEYPGMTDVSRAEKADRSLDRAVTENPDKPEARLARYQYRRKYGLPGAEEDLQQALALAPHDVDVLLAAGERALASARQRKATDAEGAARDLAQARGYYEQLTTDERGQRLPASFLGLGEVWRELGEVDKALAAWREGIRRFPQPTVLVAFHARVAETCLEQQRIASAKTELDAIDQILAGLRSSVSREEKLALARAQDLRRAQWHIQRGEWASALGLLRQVVLSQPKGDANPELTVRACLLLGAVYSALGEWLDAATAFDQAGQLDPALSQARLAAASAWLNAGRADVATERAEQALAHASTLEAWSALALAQMQQQLALPPRQRSWSRCEQAIGVLRANKGKPGIAAPWRIDILWAEYLAAKGRSEDSAMGGVDAALAVLRAAEEEYRAERDFWVQVCFAYQGLGRPEDADRALAEVRARQLPPVDLAVLEARLALLRGDLDQARRRLAEVAAEASPEVQMRLRGELLRVVLAAGDTQQGRELLLQMHAQEPANVSVLRRLAELDLRRRDLAAVEQWEKKLAHAGTLGEPLARYFRAWRLYVSADRPGSPALHEALRELEQVMLQRPNWAEASSLAGMINQRLGRVDQAIAAYERAVDLGERRLMVFEQLVTLLDQARRGADVERYLARLEGDLPQSQRLAELAVAYEIRRERPEEALAIARKRADQRPDDPLAQLWLSRLLVLGGHADEAEQVLERTVEKFPADPRVWSGLVSLYARPQKKERLAALIARLEQNAQVPDVPKALLLAQLQELQGDKERAQQHYQAAAASAPDDLSAQLRVAQFYLPTDPAKAKPYLEAALRIDPQSRAARMMLAIAEAVAGDFSRIDALLGSGAEGNAAPDDLRLHAVLLWKRGEPADIARAATLLEGLFREGGVQPTDRLLLARLYEQQALIAPSEDARRERLLKAERQLVELSSGPGALPTHVALLVQFLIRHGRRSDAGQWLDQLEQKVAEMAKPDPATITLLVQQLLQHGSPGRAERWLARLDEIDPVPLRPILLRAQTAVALQPDADVEALVEPRIEKLLAATSLPEERQKWIGGVADLYLGLKRLPAAERWYRRLFEADPTQYSQLAVVLARQQKHSEVIALCTQAASRDDSSRPALVLAAALLENASAVRDWQPVDSLLASALARHPQDVRLLYSVALVRVLQKREAEAIALLRQVVAMTPRSVAALNNLAVLLGDLPSQRDEALQLVDRALAIAGRSPALLDTKGAILVYSGRSAEAIPVLEQAVRDPQADPRHHFHLALAYRDVGKLDEARRHLQRALDRQLMSQVLTATDQRLLEELRRTLAL